MRYVVESTRKRGTGDHQGKRERRDKREAGGGSGCSDVDSSGLLYIYMSAELGRRNAGLFIS